MKRLSAAIVSLSIASLLWFGFASSASAGRYVLDQSPTTLQEYFGRPLKVTTDANNITYTYSAVKLRRAIPTLTKTATFSIAYVNDRATSIQIDTGLSKPGESFTFDQRAASQFYNYVFGYRPSIWKQVRLPNGGGGHEGFFDNKFCLGDGVAVNFINYSQGDDWIRMVYDPICEPPYDKIN